MYKALFYLLYHFFIHPLMLTVMIFISPFHQKAKKSLLLRFPKQGRPQWKNASYKSTAPIWFHCASGEFEYMKPILRHIKQNTPSQKIMVSFSSPTYQKSIESNPDVDFCFALPFDFPATIQEMIKYYEPKLLAIARTDIWPEMIRQTANMNIPSLVFSATCGKPWPILKRLWDGVVYSYVGHIYCIDNQDKDNFINSGIDSNKITVLGDSRFDQAFYRVENKNSQDLTWLKSDIPIMIAGSTWPDDEDVLIPATQELLKYKKIKLIIAPHEPTAKHLQSLKEHLNQYGLSYSLFSEAENFHSQVLIVDQVGILAELYPKARLAFIGGSFKSKVHSVMEALVSGCKVCVGPYYKNNREAIKYQTIDQAVTVVQNKEQMTEWIREFRNTPNHIPEKVQSERGASQKIAQVIEKYI